MSSRRLYPITLLALLVALILPAPAANAATGSISTGFDNSYISGGAFVDFMPAVDLTLTGFDLHLAAVETTISIYHKPGSAGDDLDNATGAWTLLTSQTVTGQGQGNPTYVSISGFDLTAGETHGFYFHGGFTFNPETGMNTYYMYNYEDPAQVTVTNAELTIFAGWGNYGWPFGAAKNPGYSWLGTAYYSFADDEEGDSGTTTALKPGCDVLMEIPESAVGASVVEDAPVFWKPGGPTVHVLPEGTTLRAIGLDESEQYYKVIYVCDYLWLPVETLAPNYDEVWNGAPLPTVIVEYEEAE